AAVLRRELQPDVAELGEAGEHVVREPARLLPLGGVGIQLVLDEPADGGAELLVLGGERRNGAARCRRAGAGLLHEAFHGGNRSEAVAGSLTVPAPSKRDSAG